MVMSSGSSLGSGVNAVWPPNNSLQPVAPGTGYCLFKRAIPGASAELRR